MQQKILDLTQKLMKIESISHTQDECHFEEELLGIIQQWDYFKEHPQYCGMQEIEEDALHRKNVYALVKGKEDQTLIMINHHDVVSLHAYGSLQEVAYDSDALKKALLEEDVEEEVKRDILSNEWLFGRGSCDMKGGMAAEMVLLEEYAKHPGNVNLLFVSVCDEETYSKGMRHAQTLLAQLKEAYGLNYVFAINPEPSAHVGRGHVGSFGSIGKCLAMLHVAGIPSHISAIENSINPISLLSEITRLIECSEDFVDTYIKEKTTPPVFNYFRDSKDVYDYSVAHYASACCSVMMFDSSLEDVMRKLKEKCQKGIDYYHERQQLKMKECKRHYHQRDIAIYTFDELKKICAEKGVLPEMKLDEKFLFEGSRYIEQCLENVPEIQPCVVITFIPPYYPSILSSRINHERVDQIAMQVDQVLRQENLHLQKEFYFQGVSDGSYLRKFDHRDLKYLMFDEKEYYLDHQLKEDIPVLLCGPWGKDLHLRSERVNIHSLCTTTYSILETILNAFQ